MKNLAAKVTKEESGLKLITFLKSKLGDEFSLKQIKKLIDNKKCQVNGRVESFSTYIVGFGDQVTLTDVQIPSPNSKASIRFESDRILFEDEAIFIYNKPSGIVCEEEGITSIIKSYCKQAILVHRLDKETSGVLLFAKSPKVYEQFCILFKNQEVYKSYFAIVNGLPKKEAGTIKSYMGKVHGYQGQSIWASLDHTQKESKAKGLFAHTDWKLVKFNKVDGISLLQCWPKTGRTHQLRVHLSEMGHPILGDFQYGREKTEGINFKAPRVMLHAEEIGFKHPVTGKEIRVAAIIPADFGEWGGLDFKTR